MSRPRLVGLPALLAIGCLGMMVAEVAGRSDDPKAASIQGGGVWWCRKSTTWIGGACLPTCPATNYVEGTMACSCCIDSVDCGPCNGTYGQVSTTCW